MTGAAFDLADGSRRPWAIATERAGEIQRQGFGVVELQKTLEHLRQRGDSAAKYLFTDEPSAWVTVNLRMALPVGGSHRAS